jgi:FkbM family methyltransferase
MNQFLQSLQPFIEQFEDKYFDRFANFLRKYSTHLDDINNFIFTKLEKDDQKRFTLWMLKRWAGIDFVNPVEFQLYMNFIQAVYKEEHDRIELNGKSYKMLDLKMQGYNFKLATYDWVAAVHDFYYNQYEHKSFKIQKGDVIIDAGAFNGDTAVLFCDKSDNECFIHSFELLDENIELFHYNVKLNGVEKYVKLNKIALSNKSNETVKIKRVPTEGGTSIFGDENAEESIQTLTLDDYITQNSISKVDLIKMDIEGAEIYALEGAKNTIKHFRPRLALCLYHKWDDVLTIPKFLDSLGVKYKYYFKWVEINQGREAVLLAEPV